MLRASCALFNLLAPRVATDEPPGAGFADKDVVVGPETLPPPETDSTSPYASPLTISAAQTTGTKAIRSPSLLRATAISAVASYILYVAFSIGFAIVGSARFMSALIVVPGSLIAAVASLTVILSVGLPTRPGKALGVAAIFVTLTALLFAGIGLLAFTVRSGPR